jgi:hypothetical protein
MDGLRAKAGTLALWDEELFEMGDDDCWNVRMMRSLVLNILSISSAAD